MRDRRASSRRGTWRFAMAGNTLRKVGHCSLLLVLGLFGVLPSATADEPGGIDIGTRRELFVDEFLIDRRDGLELRLQAPLPREVVLEHDAPWEGSGCGYPTIFRDGEVVRMYYIAADLTNVD